MSLPVCDERPVAIFLCTKTGNAAEPWRDAGYDCWCIDIQHSIRRTRKKGGDVADGIRYVWGDVRTWCPSPSVLRRLAFLCAFPPCTHVALSDSQDFRIKGVAMLTDALELFVACERAAKWAGVPYYIENPKSMFTSYISKPDEKFQPWEYGDLWFKETWLWTGNGFVMPKPIFDKPPEGTTAKIHDMGPSDDRADERAITPPLFSKAVFEANHNAIQQKAQAA